MLHKHHIIPKHLGGSDDESNIISLTVEQHSEAHRILYETHGKIEDYLAWKKTWDLKNNPPDLWSVLIFCLPTYFWRLPIELTILLGSS